MQKRSSNRWTYAMLAVTWAVVMVGMWPNAEGFPSWYCPCGRYAGWDPGCQPCEPPPPPPPPSPCPEPWRPPLIPMEPSPR